MVKVKRISGIIVILISVSALLLIPTISPLQVFADGPDVEYYRVRTVVVDGKSLDQVIINGPPTPPLAYARTTVELPEPSKAAGINVLANVPALDWSYGCSATSAAMIAGYYDRTLYPAMYTGPTNGGVFPLPTDDTIWGSTYWPGGTQPVTCMECPLSATHDGIDGRDTTGHVDDYWTGYGNSGDDPFDGNWAEHSYGDCTGDYMKTNQDAYGNSDGSTTFWNYANGAPMHDYNLEALGAGYFDHDGGYGLKLFYESRGYTVTSMYNQYIDALGLTYGFTFEQYKAEIDAGRPVMIHLEGHTIVGLGYDDTSSDLMYVHDTWDYSSHLMIWGETYSGYQHLGVTVIQLAAVVSPLVVTNDASSITDSSATLNGNLDNLGTASTVDVSFEWGETIAYGNETTPEAMTTTGPFSFSLTSLSLNTTYHFRAKAVGDGTSYGDDKSFIASIPPAVTSVDPGSGYRLQTLDVIITGTNLTGATGISFGADVTVNSFTVDSDTQITSNITIAGDTTPGMRDVSVTTPGGIGALTDGFEVTAPVGLLRVQTSPPVPTRVFLDGIPRNDWGLDWVKIPAGGYTLSFSDVPGYLAPISQPIEILPDTVTEVIASFTQLGNLWVETSPALPATIFANGNPMNDWGFWASLEDGEYTVSFQDMDGYLTPPPAVVTVNHGVTTHVVGNYETGETTVNP